MNEGPVLVTGAAGKTGRAVIAALGGRGVAVRAFARRPDVDGSLAALGAREIVVGDLLDQGTWTAAVAGASALYHIAPNMFPGEVEAGSLMLKSAHRAGMRHVVYHSVLHPQSEAMPHHWNKLRVEEMLLESGLPFTILQPSAYMQNVLAGLDAIREHGVWRVPYGIETRLNLVDLPDVAAAAAIVVTEPGHLWAAYELCGPQTLSQTEVAAVLSEVLGKRIHAEAVSLVNWERTARAGGLSDYTVNTLLAMFHFYDRYGFPGNSSVLHMLLGRDPTTFDAAARRTMVR